MSGAEIVANRGQSAGIASGTVTQAPAFSDLIRGSLVMPVVGRHPAVHFIREGDRSNAIELLLDLASQAVDPSIVRFAGGCKGFTPEMEEAFVKLTIGACASKDGKRAFRGTVGSGATQEFDDKGKQKIMITQAPYIMGRYTDCMTWGSAPQTATATQDVDRMGALRISKYGALLDPNGHANFLTQNTATTFQGWDGDVRLYIEAQEKMMKNGYKAAVVVVNGGDITKDEALLALSKGISVVLVDGSERAAAELVQAARSADPASEFQKLYEAAFTRGLLDPEKDKIPGIDKIKSLIKFAELNSAGSLSTAFDELGLLAQI